MRKYSAGTERIDIKFLSRTKKRGEETDSRRGCRLRTAMLSSRGRAAKRSLSRVGLYDPVRIAQPVVSSFFQSALSPRMRARTYLHACAR